MEEKYVESERGRTYYWVERSTGPAAQNLVFLHGLTANHHLFDPQLAHFAKRHTVLAWDAPAHGRSRPYRGFSYPHLAQELKAALDAEGLERVVLIGQSAGGFVAQSFLSQYGDRALGLLTIGTCPYGAAYYSGSDLFWLRQTEWMARLFPDRLLRRAMAGMCGSTAAGRENMLRMLEDYGKRELCRLMYLGFAGFIPEIGDVEIPCPVCLTVGEMDRTGKVRRYNEAWHKREGYPLHVIRGAAHNANVDRPEEMNALIEAFLAELGRRGVPPEEQGRTGAPPA